MNSTLNSIIYTYIQLPNHPTSSGWYRILCPICHDHGKKGPRAGFRFDNDIVSYNCFNCGHQASYNPHTSKTLDHNMITVLNAFSVPETEWRKVTLTALTHQTQQQKSTETFNTTEIVIPSFFYPLTNDMNDKWCQFAIEYLTERRIDWTSYNFFCVDKQNHPDINRWYGRLIIPIYKNTKLIYYVGRDLVGAHTRKYLNASTPRNNVLYGFDNIHLDTQEPIFVTEGWFDAFLLNGVAVFGNKMTKGQIHHLNTSKRDKIVIPDRYGNGHLLANQAISLGWKVGCLDWNDDTKDVNDSVIKHGLLYTIKTIIDNTLQGEIARVIPNNYCKRN